jgi:hypothetical protein
VRIIYNVVYHLVSFGAWQIIPVDSLRLSTTWTVDGEKYEYMVRTSTSPLCLTGPMLLKPSLLHEFLVFLTSFLPNHVVLYRSFCREEKVSYFFSSLYAWLFAFGKFDNSLMHLLTDAEENPQI